MRARWIAAAVVVVVLGFTLLFPQAASAQGEVRVLSSNGMKAVMEELRPQCERATGHSIAFQFSSAAALKQKIEAGEPFDLAVLTPQAIDDLIKAGKVMAGVRADIARCGIGVGIRAGAPKPDISTVEALKQTLLDAKSITYAKDGASRIPTERMFQRLGIAEYVKSKIMFEQAGGAQLAVAEGRAELVLTLISEIPPVPGIELVGPLPADVQGYVSFAAGVAAGSSNAQAAQALLKFLSGPSAATVIKAKGMEPR